MTVGSGRAALAQNKTQGVALGYELLPFQGVLLLRTSALYLSLRPVTVGSGRAAVVFLAFRACCCGLFGLQGVLLWAS